MELRGAPRLRNEAEEGRTHQMAVQPETLDSFDDRQLVVAFQAGEDDAFARIVGTHYSSLLAEARRRLRSAADAEDAVQETLLSAYLALDRFGGEYRLRAWLSRILANACADARARRSGDLRLVDRLAHRRDEVPGADDGAGNSELRRKVREAIASLPDSYRAAFVLREVEQRSYAEVAEEMSVTEPNARVRVHRARNSLARALRDTGAALSGFAIPLRLLGWRWLAARSRHMRERSLAAHPEAVQTSVSGVSPTAAHAAALPPTSQAPLSALSQFSQVLTQATSNPLSQTVLAIVPDAGRASLPVAGMLATMAAAGAMVAAGTSAFSPAANLATSAASVASPPAALTSRSGAPAVDASADGQTNTTAATGTSSAGDTPVPGASATTGADPSQVATVGSDAWQWVVDAATALSGALPTASSSASASSASQGAGQAGATSTSSTSAEQVVCPWPGSFPGASQGTITLPAPEAAGTLPSAYFSSDTVEVSGAGPAFEVAGQGSYTAGSSGSLTTKTLYGACLPGTTDPVLLANLSNPANPALGQLQLAGALLSSSSTDGETVALYRGTATWLDGPEVSAPPSLFVAEVVLEVPTDISTLRVAFFGAAPDLYGTPAAFTSQGAGGSSTDGNSADTTTAPDTSTGSLSGSDNSSSGAPDASSTTSSVASGSSELTSNSPSSSEPTTGPSSGATSGISSAGESATQTNATSAGVQNDTIASSTNLATTQGTPSTTTGVS